MALEQTKTYTIEEFERFLALPENADRLFELIDGEIVEKMPTEEHWDWFRIEHRALHTVRISTTNTH